MSNHDFDGLIVARMAERGLCPLAPADACLAYRRAFGEPGKPVMVVASQMELERNRGQCLANLAEARAQVAAMTYRNRYCNE